MNPTTDMASLNAVTVQTARTTENAIS